GLRLHSFPMRAARISSKWKRSINVNLSVRLHIYILEKFNGLMDPYEAKALTVLIVCQFIECMKKKEENKRVISPAVSFTPLYIWGSVTVRASPLQLTCWI